MQWRNPTAASACNPNLFLYYLTFSYTQTNNPLPLIQNGHLAILAQGTRYWFETYETWPTTIALEALPTSSMSLELKFESEFCKILKTIKVQQTFSEWPSDEAERCTDVCEVCNARQCCKPLRKHLDPSHTCVQCFRRLRPKSKAKPKPKPQVRLGSSSARCVSEQP